MCEIVSDVKLSTSYCRTAIVSGVASVGWRRLQPGSGAGALIAIDFTLAKVRAQANFADLAAQLPAQYSIWGSDETGWPSVPGDPRGQLDEWLARAAQVDAPVRAVLGFCASATLALALAEHLAAAGQAAPAVVLFDPVTVGARTLMDQAREAMSHLAAGHGPSAEPVDLDNDIDIGLDNVATRLAARYAERAAAVGIAQSIPASIVDQLCRRVSANLRFLTMCGSATTAERRPDLLVLSRDHRVPSPWRDAPEVRLGVGRNDLLAHAPTAQATAQLLSGVRS